MYVYLLLVHYSVLFIVYYFPAYVDESGVTPAHFAAQRGHIDCLMVNKYLHYNVQYNYNYVCVHVYFTIHVLITTNHKCLCLELIPTVHQYMHLIIIIQLHLQCMYSSLF